MLLRTFTHRGAKVRLHVHDAFEESQHPRGKSGENAGQFVKKGESGTASKENETVQRSGSIGQPPQEQPKPDEGRGSGRSGGNGVRSDGLDVAGTYHGREDGHTGYVFHEVKATKQSAKVYSDYITDAKNSSKYGAAVHVYPSDDYADMRLFLTPDGGAGFALKGDDIISAFKGKNGPPGVCSTMLDVAVKQGGRRLDCFDTVLPAMYNQSGFQAVARMPFDDQFKPDDWDYDTFKKYKDGKPDVVFMVYDPDNKKLYAPDDGETISDYDDGEKYQKRALGTTQDAPEFDFPIPLDPDLRSLARNKPYNVIQDIFRIQAERERSRGPSRDSIFKIRDTRVFLHFHDFEEAKVSRVKGGPEAGEFTSKGKGGGGGEKKPRERKRERGFESAEGGGKAGFTLPGGGSLPKHIAALRIPPAWTDVRYNPDPKGALLVAGTDSKNRRQPLYSEKYENAQAALKFKRSQILEKKFDRVLEKNTKCLKSRDARTRDLAGVLALIMHTAIRPGGEQDTGADYKSYGATTLEGQHVITDENGDTALRFVSGKHKGKDVTIPITDPEVAQMLKERAKQSGEGKKLFPNADPRRLLAHVKGLAGADFKTKDFRTLIGTRVAAGEIANMPIPKSPAEYKKFAKEVATKVSEKLGNTPTVAMKSYIAPHVFADWKLASGA